MVVQKFFVRAEGDAAASPASPLDPPLTLVTVTSRHTQTHTHTHTHTRRQHFDQLT